VLELTIHVLFEELGMKKILLVIIMSFTLTSCNQNMTPGLTSVVTWQSNSSQQTSRKLPSDLQTPQSVESIVTPFYANYGNLVATITPLKFKIPLQAVELSNAERVVKPIPFHQFDEENQKWIMQYGDFTSNMTTDPEQLPTDKYTDFFLFFFDNAGSMGMSSTPGIDALYTNEIVIDLPDEYAGIYPIEDVIQNRVFWPDPNDEDSFEMIDLYIDGEPIYTTRVIDSNKAIYQVTLNHLMPGVMEALSEGYRLERKRLNVFWFNGEEYVTYDIPEGLDSHRLSDYKTTPGMDINGNSVYTRLPWDGVEIHQEAAQVEFEIFWDLENLIEIYDNFTPSVLSDDILILKDKFWERIHMTVRQYDVNGIELYPNKTSLTM
jgi:hypothetical protein